jgi:hypothetical protein
MYDLTLLQNTTNFVSVTDYLNVVTGGFFWYTLIICLFIVFTLALKRYGFAPAILASSFVCFILSIILMNLNYLSGYYALFFGVASALIAVYLFVTNG